MNAAKWAQELAIDGAIAALFVAWKGYGIEGAGNVVLLFLWIVLLFGLLVGLTANKSWFKTERTPAFAVYDWTTTFLLFAALAFYDHTALATLALVTPVFVAGARTREPETD